MQSRLRVLCWRSPCISAVERRQAERNFDDALAWWLWFERVIGHGVDDTERSRTSSPYHYFVIAPSQSHHNSYIDITLHLTAEYKRNGLLIKITNDRNWVWLSMKMGQWTIRKFYGNIIGLIKLIDNPLFKVQRRVVIWDLWDLKQNVLMTHIQPRQSILWIPTHSLYKYFKIIFRLLVWKYYLMVSIRQSIPKFVTCIVSIIYEWKRLM